MSSESPRESTFRAWITGAVIGALLAAGNVYTGLKVGFIDGCAVTAALLGHALLHRGRARSQFTALENNVVQATAASAAVMGAVAGLMGPVTALFLLGQNISNAVLIVWAIVVGVAGSMVALTMRRQWMEEEQLAFPSGAATARVIRSAFALHESILSRIGIIFATAAVAMLVTVMRERLEWLPQVILAPVAIGGISLAGMGAGVAMSPLAVSTGAIIGVRGALAMGLGSVLAWYVAVPRLVQEGVLATADYSSGMQWLVWPAAALMVSGALTSLALDWRAGVGLVRDLARGAQASTSDSREDENPRPRPSRGGRLFIRALPWISLGALVCVLVLLFAVFRFSLLDSVLVCALAILLVIVCGRAVGETDMSPVGAISAIAQLGFGASGAQAALGASSAPAGMASSATQLLYSLKSGKILGSSVRGVLGGHFIGIFVGAISATFTYRLLAEVYEIGGDAMPAPGVMSSRATAQALAGTASLPEHASTALIAAAVGGVLLTLLSRLSFRWVSWLPSPIAMGVAFVVPPSYSAAIVFGGGLVLLARRVIPDWGDEDLMTAAAGGIAGESFMGVVLAGLLAAGM